MTKTEWVNEVKFYQIPNKLEDLQNDLDLTENELIHCYWYKRDSFKENVQTFKNRIEYIKNCITILENRLKEEE